LAAEDETRRSPNRLTKTRMEAFSDAVLAIAITLLVLDLSLRPPGSPLKQFLEAWPSYLAYVVSFLTIGSAWIDHNALTDRLERVDTVLLRLNLLFLLLVAFLPFPTRLVAESLHETLAPERVATVVYGITLLAIQLMFAGMDGYTRREHLLLAGVPDPDLRDQRRKFRYVVVAYLITILLAVAVPAVAVAFYFAIAIFLVVPFRAVFRVLSGKQPE
jgi:uncharacterized membrane protein